MDEVYITYYSSPLGELEIKSTETAILSVLFVDSGKKVISKKQPSQHFPNIIVECIQQLDEYFEGKRKTFELLLSHVGTDFQKHVWTELEKIPYGKTISYLELAKKIGDVKSIRAVGTTNGKNKIAIIVPCHRVIGSDGSLTGYAGGMQNKQWLLTHEAKHAHGVQELF